MEATIIGASSILALALVWFAVAFWYGKTIAKAVKPVGEVYEAASMHATVYAAEIKVSAINKASQLEVDTKKVAIARDKLALVNGFNFDLEEEEVVVAKK